jgi:hypothetical protein
MPTVRRLPLLIVAVLIVAGLVLLVVGQGMGGRDAAPKPPAGAAEEGGRFWWR